MAWGKHGLKSGIKIWNLPFGSLQVMLTLALVFFHPMELWSGGFESSHADIFRVERPRQLN